MMMIGESFLVGGAFFPPAGVPRAFGMASCSAFDQIEISVRTTEQNREAIFIGVPIDHIIAGIVALHHSLVEGHGLAIFCVIDTEHARLAAGSAIRGSY